MSTCSAFIRSCSGSTILSGSVMLFDDSPEFCSEAVSFAFLRFHMSFLRHRGHKTTLTKADLFSPCSTYANGSSSVVKEGFKCARRSGISWNSQRVLPHVVSPFPERTSSSVLQRKANWQFRVKLILTRIKLYGKDLRFRTCNA